MRLHRSDDYHADLIGIVEHIAQDNRAAALAMWDTIERQVERLTDDHDPAALAACRRLGSWWPPECPMSSSTASDTLWSCCASFTAPSNGPRPRGEMFQDCSVPWPKSQL